MYVLVIGRAYPNLNTGMMGIFEFEHAKALQKYNCEVAYAFCDTRSIKSLQKFGYYNIISDDVDVVGYHLPIKGLPRKIFSKTKNRYYKKILNEIIKIKGIPDIIHVHFPILNLTEELWSELLRFNRPIVVTEHWSKVQTKSLNDFQRNFLRRVVEESDDFICVGDLLKRSVVELTDTNKEIKVIPNMISTEFRYTGMEPKSSKKFNFISVGRLVELKRFDQLIDAFTLAFKENKNIQLTIVGDGVLYKQLKQQINKLQMQDQIQMKGFLSRSETASMIQQSNALVSASVLETFGVPFIEALACGKPIISVKDSSIEKYINESNGIVFEPNNVDDLAEKLREMYNKRHSYNGKRIAMESQNLFSEEAVTREIIRIYESLIKR